MQIDIKSLEIDFKATGTDEIYQNLKVIFTTQSGTVALDRDFGIDFSVVDLPLQQAKAALTIEYIEKVKKYEPRVRVKQVTFKVNGTEGVLKPKVVIGLVT